MRIQKWVWFVLILCIPVLLGMCSRPAEPQFNNPYDEQSSAFNEYPELTTLQPDSITTVSAISGGEFTNDHGYPVTQRGVCWHTSAEPGIEHNCTSDGSGTGSFTSSLTNLNPDTRYYVRAYATNAVGTAYGTQREFRTTDGRDGGISIYYLSDETGVNNIYRGALVSDQLTEIEQVTFLAGNLFILGYDVCSLTGRIAYVAADNFQVGDLYVMTNSRSEPVRVPNMPGERAERVVTWSPDGEKFLFSLGSARWNEALIIATIKPDGREFDIIITTNQPMGRASHKNTFHWIDTGMYIGNTPQWAAAATDHDVWFRDNSGNFTNVTNTREIGESHARVSPNERLIVFQTLDNPGRQGIRTMSIQGSQERVLIEHSTLHRTYPNGWLDDEIILYTFRNNVSDSFFDLYLMDKDGSNRRNISNQPAINNTNAKIIIEK